jgi:uncharacterized membrane protein
MTLDPLLSAPRPILTHAVLAFTALALGGWQLAAAKGTQRHRAIGWLWVGAMAFVAASGFFIHTLHVSGRWSPIHVPSAVTLVSLVYAVSVARRGNIAAHRGTMVSLFWLALVVTGAFTFFPGRIMWLVATGG